MKEKWRSQSEEESPYLFKPNQKQKIQKKNLGTKGIIVFIIASTKYNFNIKVYSQTIFAYKLFYIAIERKK